MPRTEGNVYGLLPYVQSLFQEAYILDGQINGYQPKQTGMLWVSPQFTSPPQDVEKIIDYDLVDAVGFVKLWRISNMFAALLQPDTNPGVGCNAIATPSPGGVGPNSILTPPGWGDTPVCGLGTQNVFGYGTNCVFMTVNFRPPKAWARRLNYDIVVAIADVDIHANIAQTWDAVLSRYFPDEGSFSRNGFSGVVQAGHADFSARFLLQGDRVL